LDPGKGIYLFFGAPYPMGHGDVAEKVLGVFAEMKRQAEALRGKFKKQRRR
jgi:hypothetical protein